MHRLSMYDEDTTKEPATRIVAIKLVTPVSYSV